MQNKTKNKNSEIKSDFIDKLVESPAKLIPATLLTVAACWFFLWFITIALDAQAGKLDKKIEQQQFYNIIKTTYKQ